MIENVDGSTYSISIRGDRAGRTDELIARIVAAVRAAMPAEVVVVNASRPLTADRLAHAILVATKEVDRRPANDGFEWYASADEMAADILAALAAEP